MKLPANMTRAFGKVGLKLKKHGPDIMVIAGVAGTVVSTVMACKATTKLSTILDESKDTIKKINEVAADPQMADKYTPEDAKKDTTITYVQTGVKIAKLYAPAAIVGTASIVSILTGHKLINKRAGALAAAYATVDRTFKEYRGRVVDRFGKELDRELRYNIKSKEVEEVVVNEDGTTSTVKTTVQVVDPNSQRSEFTFCFDELNPCWQKDAEYNKMFLLRQQAYFNDKLKTRGHVYLNEVLDELGFDRCRAGQEVGWIYDENNPVGDNYIDFNIFDINDENKRLFVNGKERAIWLDFNVDGNILELMQ